MNVQFSVVGQVIVNDEGHLRDIQAPGPDICGDEHPAAEKNKPKTQKHETEQPLHSHEPYVSNHITPIGKPIIEDIADKKTTGCP